MKDKHVRGRRSRRRLAVAIVALAIAAPGIAIGAGNLIGPEEVALSLPGGTLALAGTTPMCHVVEEGVEFRCTLDRMPFPEFDSWLGVAEAAVSEGRVIGGCRGLTADGREWQCYLGEAAADQQIIAADLLGTERGPAVG